MTTPNDSGKEAGTATPHKAEWSSRFEKYWLSLEPYLIPDLQIKARYEGIYSNGFIAGQFHSDTGQTEHQIESLRSELSTLAARLEVAEKRLHWLHDCSTGTTDPQGFEWGIYRVKWVNGVAAEVWQTASDFSDLDAEMARELEPPCPDCAKAMKKHASLDARMAQRGNFGIVPLPMKCAKHSSALTNINAGEERK